MKMDKNPWLQLKDIMKQSAKEIVDGFADISRMIIGNDSKKTKKK